MSKRDGKVRLLARLWFVLALPSIFIFTALPLSGLTMEMTSGYRHDKNNDTGPAVVGFSYSNFNERFLLDLWQRAAFGYGNAYDASVLGYGAIYTPDGYKRSQHDSLKKVPAALPKDNGVDRIFLTAQTENPIEGSSWDLLLQYNCSIVDKFENFRILYRYMYNYNTCEAPFGRSGETVVANDNSIVIMFRNQTNQIGCAVLDKQPLWRHDDCRRALAKAYRSLCSQGERRLPFY